MGINRRLSLAGVLLALLGGAVWCLFQPPVPEPLIDGKPLSFWLKGYYFGPNSPERRKADEVVRQLGTNAIPIAIGMICEHHTTVNRALMSLSRNQPYVDIKYRDVDELNYFGSMMFVTLGPEAREAVPALTAILEKNPSTSSRLGAACALGAIGPAAAKSVPALLPGVADTNALMRLYCIIALGQIHDQPDSVVPMLANVLGGDLPRNRGAAITALGAYEQRAAAALPALLLTLNDRDARIRSDTTNALRKIDPENADRLCAAAPGPPVQTSNAPPVEQLRFVR